MGIKCLGEVWRCWYSAEGRRKEGYSFQTQECGFTTSDRNEEHVEPPPPPPKKTSAPPPPIDTQHSRLPISAVSDVACSKLKVSNWFCC